LALRRFRFAKPRLVPERLKVKVVLVLVYKQELPTTSPSSSAYFKPLVLSRPYLVISALWRFSASCAFGLGLVFLAYVDYNYNE